MDGMTNNDRLIRWIQRRAEGFRGDIAVIAAYGSYINGTANPRSDVDCYFVPKTERGGKFAATFILAGVGYDIFPMNWARLERIADLRDPLTPLVGDVRLLYCDTEADLERFGRLQQALRDNLNDPARARAAAKERYALARALYAGMAHTRGLTGARVLAGRILMALADAAAAWNQEYFHFGLKRQFADLQRFQNMPAQFTDDYLRVIQAESEAQTTAACASLLASFSAYTGWDAPVPGGPPAEQPQAAAQAGAAPNPCYASLAGLYEEIRSSFQKIYACRESGDAVLAFLCAACLQSELMEISREYDFFHAYRFGDLQPLASAAEKAENALVRSIEAAGGRIKRYADFAAFEQAAL